jgi:hypothetical protein
MIIPMILIMIQMILKMLNEIRMEATFILVWVAFLICLSPMHGRISPISTGCGGQADD